VPAVIAVIAVMTNLLATSVVKMGIETTELFSVWLFSDWGAAASPRVPVSRTPDSKLGTTVCPFRLGAGLFTGDSGPVWRQATGR
jgi:hypothetical protein